MAPTPPGPAGEGKRKINVGNFEGPAAKEAEVADREKPAAAPRLLRDLNLAKVTSAKVAAKRVLDLRDGGRSGPDPAASTSGGGVLEPRPRAHLLCIAAVGLLGLGELWWEVREEDLASERAKLAAALFAAAYGSELVFETWAFGLGLFHIRGVGWNWGSMFQVAVAVAAIADVVLAYAGEPLFAVRVVRTFGLWRALTSPWGVDSLAAVVKSVAFSLTYLVWILLFFASFLAVAGVVGAHVFGHSARFGGDPVMQELWGSPATAVGTLWLYATNARHWGDFLDHLAEGYPRDERAYAWVLISLTQLLSFLALFNGAGAIFGAVFQLQRQGLLKAGQRKSEKKEQSLQSTEEFQSRLRADVALACKEFSYPEREEDFLKALTASSSVRKKLDRAGLDIRKLAWLLSLFDTGLTVVERATTAVGILCTLNGTAKREDVFNLLRLIHKSDASPKGVLHAVEASEAQEELRHNMQLLVGHLKHYMNASISVDRVQGGPDADAVLDEQEEVKARAERYYSEMMRYKKELQAAKIEIQTLREGRGV